MDDDVARSRGKEEKAPGPGEQAASNVSTGTSPDATTDAAAGTATAAGETTAASADAGTSTATSVGAGTSTESSGGAGATGSQLPGAQPSAPSKRPAAPLPKKKRSLLARLIEIPLLVILAFVIAVLIKTFLVQAFFIPSDSMNPALEDGDRVLVEKVSYAFGGPSRGDIVVFENSLLRREKEPDVPWSQDARNFLRELLGLPTGGTEDYIKRVVAIGGDRITYTGKPRVLTVNDEKVPQPFINKGVDRSSPPLTSSDCKRLKMDRAGEGCRVPAGMVFVMGDNRSDSEDSRVLGPVDEDKIVGRAVLVIWPFKHFGTL